MMSNRYTLEFTLLTALWSLESLKADDFKADTFEDCKEEFNKIVKYRKEGYTAGDIILSSQIMGNDLTAKLVSNLPKVVESSIPFYKRELEIIRFKEKLYQNMTENTITAELLEEGLSVFNKPQEDGNLYDLSGNLEDYMTDLEKRIDKKVEYYELGFKQLDEYIAPIEPGTFIIVKALKKTGKTNFAIKVFLNMLAKNIPCLYLTSEMGYFKLIDKLVSMSSGFSARKIRKGDINRNTELSGIANAIVSHIAGKKGYIYQTGMFDTSKISELITQTGAKVLFIDYLQMVKLEGKGNRAEELEEIAIEIKDLAMSRNIVCVGMSQENKEGGTKHCLSFEEKADQVIRLQTSDDSSPLVKTLDVSVEFNRYGSTGLVKMVLKKIDCNIAEMDFKEENEDWRTK